MSVEVDPKPSIDAVFPAAICSGASFSVSPVNGGGINSTDIVPANTTYTWTVFDSSGLVTGETDTTTAQTSISQTLTNDSNVPQTVVYTVTPTSGAQGTCVGETFEVTVVVNPTPVIPNLTDEICSGETFTVTPLNTPPATIVPAGTTYVWTVFDSSGLVTGETDTTTAQTAISQTLTNDSNVPQTVVYTVTPTSGADGSCVGLDFTVSVEVDPKPSIDAVFPAAICSGASFSVSPVNGGGINSTDIVPANTTYTWTVFDSSGLVTGETDTTTAQTAISQTLTNGSNVPQTVVYTVTPTSGAQGTCVGETFEVTVVVNPQPTIYSIDPQTILFVEHLICLF